MTLVNQPSSCCLCYNDAAAGGCHSLPAIVVVAIFDAIHRKIIQGCVTGMPLIPVPVQVVNVPETVEMGIAHKRRTT